MKSIEQERNAAHATRRRTILKTGLAAALLPLLPLFPLAPARAASNAAVPGRGFDVVLYDERHARARAYGRALHKRADAVRAMSGDPTSAWTDLLDPLWRRGPARVAGMTSAQALFCIEQMAHSHGMRVLERGTPDGDQALVAWVIGPARQMES